MWPSAGSHFSVPTSFSSTIDSGIRLRSDIGVPGCDAALQVRRRQRSLRLFREFQEQYRTLYEISEAPWY